MAHIKLHRNECSSLISEMRSRIPQYRIWLREDYIKRNLKTKSSERERELEEKNYDESEGFYSPKFLSETKIMKLESLMSSLERCVAFSKDGYVYVDSDSLLIWEIAIMLDRLNL